MSQLHLPPQEAWLRFEPSERQPFDRRAAAHLFRRAGFAGTLDQLDAAVVVGPVQAVEQLAGDGETQDFDQQMQQLSATVLAVNNPEGVATWWLYRMRHTPAQFLEKATLFWHGHFATSAAKVNKARLMHRQNELLRQHALGKFEPLVQAVARDPAMLLYLDSATNKKTHPNENFARELLELFCLGVGNYSERDIQQLARCFTGWEIVDGDFRFHSYQHDYGRKSLFGQEDNWDGADAIRVVLAQPAAANFLCRKLVRFYVSDELTLSDEEIAPLAHELRDSEFDIGRVTRTILTSRAFYSPTVRGAKVRSPVEVGIGLMRFLDATGNLQQLAAELRNLGQLPLYPPNVKGWSGGRDWLNSSTLVGRINLSKSILSSPGVRFGGGSLDGFFESAGLKTPAEVVEAVCEGLLAVEPPVEVRNELVAKLQQAGDPNAKLKQVLHLVTSLPEFQLA
jgi:uncharacterized protein (DUF1800 family)